MVWPSGNGIFDAECDSRGNRNADSADDTKLHDQFRLPVEAEGIRTKPWPRGTNSNPRRRTGCFFKVNFVFNRRAVWLPHTKVDGTEYFKDGFGISPTSGGRNDYGNGARRLHGTVQQRLPRDDRHEGKHKTKPSCCGQPRWRPAESVSPIRYASGIVHDASELLPMWGHEQSLEAARMATFLRKWWPAVALPSWSSHIGVRFAFGR